jgi:hypothetical protein
MPGTVAGLPMKEEARFSLKLRRDAGKQSDIAMV